LSSPLLFKNVNIKIYAPTVLYGCSTSFLALKGKRGLRVFENRVLRKIFGLKRDEATGGWRKCIIRSLITFTLRQV
jgi:hypothetical protein